MTYHVMTRGNNRQPIFDDDRDRWSLLGLIDDVRRRQGWRVHAWCLMTNHVHLLITTEQPNLSDGLRDVMGRYARRFNHFHERTGHLFTGRFRSVVVTTDEQFLATFRYVNRNPVAAGLAPEPSAYRWSGYATRHLPRPPIALDEGTILRILHPVTAMAERQIHALVNAEMRPSRAGASVPEITTLIQAFGPEGGARAARLLGHRQRTIAEVVGISESALSRRLQRSLPRAS